MCLLGVAKAKFNIYTPFSPKTAILGPELDGKLTYKLSAEKTALTLEVLSVNGP